MGKESYEFSICCGLMLTNTVNELTVQNRRIGERQILENPFYFIPYFWANHPFLGTVHYGQGGRVTSFKIPELVMLA